MVRNCIFPVAGMPRVSSRCRKNQLYLAPVSTKRSSSSTLDGVARFQTARLLLSRPTSCKASRYLAKLLHAGKIEFHRRGASKNRHRNLQPAVIVVDLFDVAVEIRKRPIDDAHLLVALEDHLRLGAVLRRVYAIDDAVDFRFRQRRR